MGNTTTIGEDDDDLFVRPFADFLREQSGGKSHDELSEGLHDLIAKVSDTGKAGSITYVVTVKPLKDDLEVFIVSDEIKLKLPEHDRKASMFYPDENGNLTRTDPRQLTFDSLREVPAGVDPVTGEIREVEAR